MSENEVGAKVDEALARGDEVAAPKVPEVEVKAPEVEAKKENFIPRDRFNEAVAKERAKTEVERARAAELESMLTTQNVSVDVTEAQKQIKEFVKQRNGFLAEGELDKAGEVDAKIFAYQEAIADRKAEVKAFQAKESAKEEFKYDQVVARLEIDHPELDPDNEDYNEEAVIELRSLMRGYQQEMRLSPSKALEKAALRVFGKAQVAGNGDGGRRKAEAVERNIAAAKQQPPKLDAGLDHDKKGGGLDAKTIMNLPYEEFSKLDEATLSRIRGDAYG